MHRRAASSKGRIARALAGLVLAGALGLARVQAATEPPIPGLDDPAAAARGGTLARTYCITCHLFPEADALDRANWMEQVLPRMKYRLGFTTPQLEQSPNIRLLRERNRIPARPVITEAQWTDIAAYYWQRSPEQSLPQENPPRIELGVPGFRMTPLERRPGPPAVTAVKILPGAGALWADAGAKAISWMGADGRVRRTLECPDPVGSFRTFPRGLLVAGLGSFLPSDALLGKVFWMTSAPEVALGPAVLSGLPRTPDANEADLNGDGRPDYVVSCFGNNVGRLSWWEGRPDGTFLEHELFGLPGTLRTEVGDFNGDGHPDVVALVAQETEGLLLFLGDGKGGFTRKTVFQRPPYWGHSYFEVADFNGDGRPDFLVTNGDNGEFSSASKRYHGVRVYLAQPDNTWRESAFIPVYGAYKAVARDFDRDGDLDVAVVSYFPDYQRSPRGSFVFLRNQGGLRFEASTFAESALGRWVTLDVGDFDGDGDDDLVLGSYVQGPTPVPAKLMQAWQEVGQPLTLLQNQLR